MHNFTESLYDCYGQEFKIDKVYFKETTDHQDLIIFHNAKFGRVMALDGVVQTTEADEFIYHEMLTHVPVLAHGDVKSVLIIGGGDGGMLREVCRHQQIEHITQVEIDMAVVDMCKTYLPKHSNGAYDDPRLNLVIADGADFVKNSTQQFDVIISDSTDPIGPGEALFTYEFYQNCQKLLSDNGILVTQNGVAFHQLDEAINTAKNFQEIFVDWGFYGAAVPTYVGGIMMFGFASNSKLTKQRSIEELTKAFQQAKLDTRYYNADIHQASFALPEYIRKAL